MGRAEVVVAWVDAFVDVPATRAAAYRSFWSAVTGWAESAPRGDRGQFRSLLPDPAVAARAYLRVQELERTPRVLLASPAGAAGSPRSASTSRQRRTTPSWRSGPT